MTGCAAERRKREPHRALGEPIDRRHRLRGKAIAAKSLDESAQRLHADRLRAVRNHAQRAEIEPLRSASAILLRHSSNPKFGAAEKVARKRWIAHSQLSGRTRKLSGDMT